MTRVEMVDEFLKLYVPTFAHNGARRSLLLMFDMLEVRAEAKGIEGAVSLVNAPSTKRSV